MRCDAMAMYPGRMQVPSRAKGLVRLASHTLLVFAIHVRMPHHSLDIERWKPKLERGCHAIHLHRIKSHRSSIRILAHLPTYGLRQ